MDPIENLKDDPAFVAWLEQGSGYLETIFNTLVWDSGSQESPNDYINALKSVKKSLEIQPKPETKQRRNRI